MWDIKLVTHSSFNFRIKNTLSIIFYLNYFLHSLYILHKLPVSLISDSFLAIKRTAILPPQFRVGGANIARYNTSHYKAFTFTNSKILPKVRLRQLFKSYLKLNFYIPYEVFSVHASYYIYGIYNCYNGPGIFNLTKLFYVWSLVVIFIENIFFYDLRVLCFSTPYFRDETLALNWTYFKFFKSSWRFSRIFYFFINNKNTEETALFFKSIGNQHTKLTFLIDTFFHKNTLHFLNKNKFISIGAVPLTSNLYLLSVSLPIATNTLLSNLFFMRLILKLKVKSSSYLFNSRFTHWYRI